MMVGSLIHSEPETPPTPAVIYIVQQHLKWSLLQFKVHTIEHHSPSECNVNTVRHVQARSSLVLHQVRAIAEQQ